MLRATASAAGVTPPVVERASQAPGGFTVAVQARGASLEELMRISCEAGLVPPAVAVKVRRRGPTLSMGRTEGEVSRATLSRVVVSGPGLWSALISRRSTAARAWAKVAEPDSATK
jgi:hypothetical protein